jgi:hypothetical protein
LVELEPGELVVFLVEDADVESVDEHDDAPGRVGAAGAEKVTFVGT